MGELVVRLVGGVHALFGIALFAAGLSGEAPETGLDWVAVVLGEELGSPTFLTGLPLGLGDPVPPTTAALFVLATLLAALAGVLLMQLPR